MGQRFSLFSLTKDGYMSFLRNAIKSSLSRTGINTLIFYRDVGYGQISSVNQYSVGMGDSKKYMMWVRTCPTAEIQPFHNSWCKFLHGKWFKTEWWDQFIQCRCYQRRSQMRTWNTGSQYIHDYTVLNGIIFLQITQSTICDLWIVTEVWTGQTSYHTNRARKF